MFTGTLAGQDLIEALDAEIARTNQGLADGLGPFDPIQTPIAWHRVLQGAEELFNLATEPFDDETLHDRLVDMPLALAVTGGRDWICQQISALYDGGVEDRVMEVLGLAASLSSACLAHGYPLALGTVADAAGYFQTRRRRMVAFLYIMPKACRGQTVARTLHDLYPLVALMEFAGGPMTDLAQMAMMSRVFDDYAVTSDGVGVLANREVDLLDEGGFDSERVSLLDMIEFGAKTVVSSTNVPAPRRLLSKAEVRMQIEYLESAFAEFGLADTSFGEIQRLITPLLTGSEDYVVSVPAEAFLRALEAPGGLSPERRRALLIHEGEAYSTAINSYQPFVRIDDQLISNVNLLTRFLNDYKTVALSPQKRFQIRSGFIFEKKVCEVLKAAGFTVTGITRVDRSEFDVVTTKAGVIHNFQCKNTFIDTRLIESDPVRYARINKAMIRSYRRAIRKEVGREQLLKTRLDLEDIRHYVVSRFPVLDDALDIIPFSKLAETVGAL